MSDISASLASGKQPLPDLPGVNAVSPEERAFNLSVGSAVRQLNAAGYAGDGREVTFSIDPATRQLVVKVIESQTKDVITQWPAKYALALAADYDNQTKDS